METRATARYIRVTPRKANQVLDLVRGRDVSEALITLAFSKKHIAKRIEKTMRSAVANAIQEDAHLDVDHLYVKEALVGPGPILKRFLPRAQGRATKFWKRTSHITIIVADKASRKGKGRPAVRVPRPAAPSPAPAGPAAPAGVKKKTAAKAAKTEKAAKPATAAAKAKPASKGGSKAPAKGKKTARSSS